MTTKPVRTAAFLWLAALLLFLGGIRGLEAASPRDLKTVVKPFKAAIGEPVTIAVEGRLAKGEEVSWPSEPDVPKFSIRSTRIRLIHRPWGRAFKATLNLVGFEPGKFQIDRLKLRFKDTDQKEWLDVAVPAVTIEILSKVTGDVEKLDIKPLKGLYHSRRPWIIGLMCLGLLAAVLLWLCSRKRSDKGATAPKIPAHVIALERLKKLEERDLVSRGLVPEFYVELSRIVRQYLEDRFNIRAPEMTTEEFLEYMKSHEALSDPHKELLRDFMNHCDLVKFARYDPAGEEIERSLAAAKKLIEETREIPPAP